MRCRISASVSRRSGVAIIYVVISLVAMLAFCSLAVDLGRVQTSKTELRRAVDAAARASAAFLPQGLSATQTEAIALAAANNVNGSALTLTNSNIQWGVWNKSTGVFTSSASATPNPNNSTTFEAVQVQVPADQVKIPLLFGSIIGMANCTVTATSVAALVAEPSSTTRYIAAHSDPWLAGEPTGTKASVPDPNYDNPSSNNDHPWKYDAANPTAVATAEATYAGGGSYTLPTDSSKVTSTDYSTGEPYASPPEIILTVAPGSIVEVSIPLNSSNINNVYGYLDGSSGGYEANGNFSGSDTYTEDDAANSTTSGGNANPGNTTGTLAQGSTSTSGLSNTEHGISNILTPFGSTVGVFLDQNGATYGADSSQETTESGAPSTPTGLNFGTQSAQNYLQIEPQLNQAFYVGSGQTSSNVQQMIVVPPNAYALFLGTMDGHEYSNNTGGFNATVTQYEVEIVK